jgi:hypothetical protein
VFFGLSAVKQPLHVSALSILLQNNTFTSCTVAVHVPGGNAYGGGISLYIGGFRAINSTHDPADAAVGDTVFRDANVTLDTAHFKSCSAERRTDGNVYGANVYGGSFSFYIGAYVWSHAHNNMSSSTGGATNISDVHVRVINVNSKDSTATQSSFDKSKSESRGAHAYGGSMSVLHVGAYACSRSKSASSSSRSTCGATSAKRVSVIVSNAYCSNCHASSSSAHSNGGTNSYGGSMSVVYVGAHCMSSSPQDSPNSTITSNCSETHVLDVVVNVSDSDCINCSASVTTVFSDKDKDTASYGANSYGGSMSVLYVGAYSWSRTSDDSSKCNSTCGSTQAKDVKVHISNYSCYNCRAITRGGLSYGANSYGGSISAAYIGAYAYCSALLVSHAQFSNSNVDLTHAETLSIVIVNTNINNSEALSGKCC